ncbi:MAG: TraB/GumN family protein [Candidatus Aenigmatarchaeota archaeon]
MGKTIVIGTSHISPRSIENVRNTILKEKPGCVAIELCPERYRALRSGYYRPSLRFGLTHYVLAVIQQYLGKKTGVLPGSEMLVAADTGLSTGAKVILIDKDIREIMYEISRIGFVEKFRLFAKILLSLLFSPFSKKQRIDLSRVPPERIIEEAMRMMKRDMPSFYKILVEDRNRYMARWIKELSKKYDKIVVVVGAGHRKGLEKMLKVRK